MYYVKALIVVMVLWSSSAMAATLSWNQNTEIDLVGYKVYQCGTSPCTPTSGAAALIVTLGKVTSYDIGTPSATKYYYITAYDTANLESGSSNVVTYTPGTTSGTSSGSTTSGGQTVTNSLANVTLTVLGTPALGSWGVEGTTTDLRDVMATIWVDGKQYWTDHDPAYSFPATTSSFTVANAKLGNGLHTVEFVFYLEGTTTEIGRANVTVMEGTTTSGTTQTVTPTVSLKVVGNPAAYSWGVEGSTTDLRDVMGTIYLDGKVYWTDHAPAYCFPATTSLTCVTGSVGAGTHTVMVVFYLEGTTTEVGRASITVKEGP